MTSVALGSTYSAVSFGQTTVALSSTYSASGTAQAQAIIGLGEGIYTPHPINMPGTTREFQEWVRRVSKALNDGIQGKEVISGVRQAEANLTTAVTEAKEAASQASASAAAATEIATTLQQETQIIRDELNTIDGRLRALE